MSRTPRGAFILSAIAHTTSLVIFEGEKAHLRPFSNLQRFHGGVAAIFTSTTVNLLSPARRRKKNMGRINSSMIA
jgi:hypothetical protein